jgi:two-component system, sensor histidine kinase and response regulator
MSAVETSLPSVWNSLTSERFRPFVVWERVGGDMELLRELVEIFSEEYPRMLGEIEFAVKEGDGKRLQKASHKLKGSLLQFAAPVATEAAATLESSSREMLPERIHSLIANLKREVDWVMDMLKAMVSRSTPGGSEGAQR